MILCSFQKENYKNDYQLREMCISPPNARYIFPQRLHRPDEFEDLFYCFPSILHFFLFFLSFIPSSLPSFFYFSHPCFLLFLIMILLSSSLFLSFLLYHLYPSFHPSFLPLFPYLFHTNAVLISLLRSFPSSSTCVLVADTHVKDVNSSSSTGYTLDG